MRNFEEQFLNWINNHTPNDDKLAHFYWGDILWTNIGYLLALILMLTIPDLFWLLLPVITVYVPARKKEQRDGAGKGTKDWRDILFTMLPLYNKLLTLIIILILKS